MPGGRDTFLIQRYSTSLWPHIRGTVPFIVRGPNVSGRHVLRRVLEAFDFDGLDPEEMRLVVSELMLREGFCVAAWPVEMETCCQPDHRWDVAVRQCADEIPKVCAEWPIAVGAWELLDGMSTIEHYRHLMVFDDVVLESMEIPGGILTP